MDIIQSYWETIIAFCALIISLVTASTSILAFNQQRKYYIKSIKPIVQIVPWDYENSLRVDLTNSGLGPAIITSVRVLNLTGEEKSSIYAWLPAQLPGEMNYKEYWIPYKEFIVQPNKSTILIEIPIDKTKPEQIQEREHLRGLLRQLKVHIEYQDMYESMMEPEVADLLHFARTDNEN